MAGARKTKSDLPPRTYFKRDAYYHVARDTGKWIRLGTDLLEAKRLGKLLLSGRITTPRMDELDYSMCPEGDVRLRTDLGRTTIRLYESASDGASQRGREFNITKQDILDLLLKANGRCMATGIPLSNDRAAGQRMGLWRPSLDRIDSSKGYIVGNLRIVCAVFNIAIQDHGDLVFEKLAIGYLKSCQRWDVRPLEIER